LRAFSYNGINESNYSEKKLINVFTYPSPPTLGTLTAGKENATFTFTTLSSSGGRPVTKYNYSIDNFASTSYETTISPVTFSSIPGTPVNIWIKSVNSLGFESTTANSFPDASAVTPYTNPSSPTITSIIPTYVNGQNTFIINYTAGANGYSPITNYYYSADNGATYTAMNVTTDGAYTIPVSFDLGSTYYFSIKSENIAGMSQPSNVLASKSFDIPFSYAFYFIRAT
jgi:predicted phage tail protein